MSDSAVVTLVSGSITIVTLVVGFLTLWVKLKYGEGKAEEVKVQASRLEVKLDDNTRRTESIESKADTIAEQTNGVTEVLQQSVNQLLDRVGKLEEYNRDSAHRIFDAVNATHLKVAEMAAVQGAKKADASGRQAEGK